MLQYSRLLAFGLTGGLVALGTIRGDAPAVSQVVPCAASVDSDFSEEVWVKIGSQKCLTCHQKGGDAEETDFLLLDPRKADGAERDAAMRHNRDAFIRMASVLEGDESRMLLKVAGKLDHGGLNVLPPDSTEYQILAAFVRRANGARDRQLAAAPLDPDAPPFFRDIVMLDDRRLLRRATLSLAGRLPTDSEFAAIAKDGVNAMPAILDSVMQEDAFYDRLREGFNDVFLTLGIDGNADQTCLSYEHFEKTRHWTATYDLSRIQDANERQRAEWSLAAEYRKTLLGEPMKLIEHIVRNDKPFTEIVTADYIMVSPYSARGYGVFDEVKGQFKNPDDPWEYVPVKLKALVGRSPDANQDSETGFYPHAGLLSTFQYLCRYPTTETNRNRLRARMYYRHFLGVDVLELAARVSDAAAATARYEIPTMQAAECVVCHRTLDPVAGLFQDYWRFADQGVYGKRKEGWFQDMFGAGFEGENLPEKERWRALQWLGERTAKDPRFAIAMVEHVYYILTGRKVLLQPKDFADPLYTARLRAYREQRQRTEAVADEFIKNGFNLKGAFKDWILTDFYRADGLAAAIHEPCREAELSDVGIVRLLSPEQVERKIAAVFGQKWGKLVDQIEMLYGGIDSKEATERAADPSGAMGAIQRTLSSDVACIHVGADFGRPSAERRLFPDIEPDVVPGVSAAGDRQIRQAIVRLHEKILGRYDAIDSAEVDRTFRLFDAIVKDAREHQGIEAQESYFCRQSSPAPPPDPHYTIRAWRAVVVYLLRRPEFLYE